MKFIKYLLLLSTVVSFTVLSNSCKDDDGDDKVNPYYDSAHQSHSYDGYRLVAPTGVFNQYHTNSFKPAFAGVEFNSVENVLRLKKDTICHILLSSSKNQVSAELFDMYVKEELSAMSAPNNYNMEPLVDSYFFSRLEKTVTSYAYVIDYGFEYKSILYYLVSNKNGRAYRIAVNGPTNNMDFWEYADQILATFEFVEE